MIIQDIDLVKTADETYFVEIVSDCIGCAYSKEYKSKKELIERLLNNTINWKFVKKEELWKD